MDGKIKKILTVTPLILALLIIQNCKNSTIITPTAEKCDTINLTYVDYYPAWSPAGNKVVFFHNGAAGGTCGIYSIDTSGTNRKLLRADCDARNPDWSPDGNWIAYESGNQLYQMTPTGFIDSLITHNISAYYPSWRYDNAWIAFDSYDSLHYYAIWKIKPDGTGKKFIGEVNSGGRMPDWSPDGKNICYQKAISSTQMQIYIMDTLGNPGMRLTNNSRNDYFPKYSPDGLKVAYTSVSSSGCVNIWLINSDGSNDIRLTDFQSEQAAWSPDGEYIVYVNIEKNDGHLWTMHKDGTGKKQLTY